MIKKIWTHYTVIKYFGGKNAPKIASKIIHNDFFLIVLKVGSFFPYNSLDRLFAL